MAESCKNKAIASDLMFVIIACALFEGGGWRRFILIFALEEGDGV